MCIWNFAVHLRSLYGGAKNVGCPFRPWKLITLSWHFINLDRKFDASIIQQSTLLLDVLLFIISEKDTLSTASTFLTISVQLFTSNHWHSLIYDHPPSPPETHSFRT